MVDFRKLLLAFAGSALLFGLGSTAYAQGTNTPPFVCTGTAGNPFIVRSEGVAELVGDLVLNCTGGTVTPYGTAIPLSNVQISLNTNVTSRLVGSAAGDLSTEALLTIDDPFPAGNGGPVPTTVTSPAGSPQTQLGCVANGTANCTIIGTGVPFGTLSPYSGSAGHYNIFQGIANGSANQINWQGVPIDAPGTQGTRIIRITNVRANASQLGAGSSLVPSQITELIGITGSQTIIINGPQQIVALVEQGLKGSVAPSAPVYQQCNNLNAFLLQGKGGNGTSGNPLYITLSAQEGFAASFKQADWYATNGTFTVQNVLGFSYNTESGFSPGSTVGGLDQTGRQIGLADTGTLVQFTITGVPSGVQLYVPTAVPLVGPGGSIQLATGTATSGPSLSNCGAAPGSGSTTAAFPCWNGTTVDPNNGYTGQASIYNGTTTGGSDLNPPLSGSNGFSTTFANFSPLTVSGGTATVTYQVTADNPSVIESLLVPVAASYITSSSTVPLAGAVSIATNFAPLATSSQQGVASGPIPRFVQTYPAVTLFTLTPCTCNLLFPFVSSAAGFDTGIAVANTSSDPYGTANQSGTVTFWYYGSTTGGGAAPPKVTSGTVASGTVLAFDLFNGGSGIAATPGFQGYIIAQANFQYCHGYAFISDLGLQHFAQGYLALVLDTPIFGTRGTPTNTTSTGENTGN